jgi:hypothetical protein
MTRPSPDAIKAARLAIGNAENVFMAWTGNTPNSKWVIALEKIWDERETLKALLTEPAAMGGDAIAAILDDIKAGILNGEKVTGAYQIGDKTLVAVEVGQLKLWQQALSAPKGDGGLLKWALKIIKENKTYSESALKDNPQIAAQNLLGMCDLLEQRFRAEGGVE